MNHRLGKVLLAFALASCTSCGPRNQSLDTNVDPAAKKTDADATADAELARHGTIEVTARLVEVPAGSIFKRDFYDYAAVLKYEVIKVQRGQLAEKVIFVGHYDPWKPRSEAADAKVKDIGGNLKSFQAGQVHRMALDVPLDDFFMGGLVNKYFGKENVDPLYWGVWTNLVSQ